jgi:hypothetical protein
MSTHLEPKTGTTHIAPGSDPATLGSLARPRRRHDRSKYPWRQQRLRRKLIQVSLTSSAALLFMFGALYILLHAH